MARLLVFVLCASMVTTQRNGNAIKSDGGESKVERFFARMFCDLAGRLELVKDSGRYQEETGEKFP